MDFLSRFAGHQIRLISSPEQDYSQTNSVAQACRLVHGIPAILGPARMDEV
ncbi:MAG: hypothetical protein WBA95_11335 [Mycolicibacter algericus]|uniref:hypothetical protein n=1 Tax=Mycolicibacter algericus TaxID=1288388 RepID=UPI003C76D74E